MTDKNKNKELVEETVDAVETEVEAPIEEAPVAPVETASDKPSKKDNKKRWYIVHTYSGYENKVKVNLLGGPVFIEWQGSADDKEQDIFLIGSANYSFFADYIL